MFIKKVLQMMALILSVVFIIAGSVSVMMVAVTLVWMDVDQTFLYKMLPTVIVTIPTSFLFMFAGLGKTSFIKNFHYFLVIPISASITGLIIFHPIFDNSTDSLIIISFSFTLILVLKSLLFLHPKLLKIIKNP